MTETKKAPMKTVNIDNTQRVAELQGIHYTVRKESKTHNLHFTLCGIVKDANIQIGVARLDTSGSRWPIIQRRKGHKIAKGRADKKPIAVIPIEMQGVEFSRDILKRTIRNSSELSIPNLIKYFEDYEQSRRGITIGMRKAIKLENAIRVMLKLGEEYDDAVIKQATIRVKNEMKEEANRVLEMKRNAELNDDNKARGGNLKV